MRSDQSVNAIQWQDNRLRLLDQRKLPLQEQWLDISEVDSVVAAIRDMVVRGAPAIGITAAYGVVIAAKQRRQQDAYHWQQSLQQDFDALAASRPTAVNLFWALQQMKTALVNLSDEADPIDQLLAVAKDIHQQDRDGNRAMGDYGAKLIAGSLESVNLGSVRSESAKSVITHCNTGSLATGGYGTALGVIRSAWREGIIDRVYADETRPWWQGARLTAWELQKDQIDVTLIADSVAATLMAQGKIAWVIVGADRIAANGDAANKIGTYSLAVLARHHGVKFMVAAPTTTFDLSISSGAEIPIEQRGEEEVVSVNGQRMAPENVAVYNPVFDVTPADLIDAIVTEKGVVEKPTSRGIAQLMGATA